MIVTGTKISVLGTEYVIVVNSAKDDPKLCDCDGYVENYSKKIVIQDKKDFEGNNQLIENIDSYQERVLKHEIIHAFLHESGLDSNSDWARNEEIVDWIALQFDKMNKCFDSAVESDKSMPIKAGTLIQDYGRAQDGTDQFIDSHGRRK